VSGDATYVPTYTYIEPLSTQKKMEERKNRQNFHGLIKKGDYYALKNERELALKYYLSVHAKLKNDRILEKKIANLSFDAKRFEQAYAYFIKVPTVDLLENEKFRMLDALVFQNGTLNVTQELASMPIKEETKQYFRVVASCTRSVDVCLSDVRASSGASVQLAELRTALEEATAMSQEPTYPQALLATTFYNQGRYLSAYFLGKDIITRRPDYRPVIKLVGMSAFRVDYAPEASKWLMQYRTFEPHDPEASAVLGDIFLESEDHVSSNLYFNAALTDGFENRTELERKLVYNYYLLDDKKGMFKVFRYLLADSGAEESDFIIAVSTSINANEMSKASLWVHK
jgi:tetratricopeptide (TPR) repeat protein